MSALKRAAKLKTFRRGEQFDRKKMLRVLDDRSQLQRASHSHRDMIFATTGGRQIVDTRRMREHLCLVEQGYRSDMQNHKAAMGSGVRRKEGRQTFIRVGIHETIGASFAD